MKKLLFLFFSISSISLSAQNEQDIFAIFGRICQTDSIQNTLISYDEDSSAVFYFKTPDVDEYGIFEYELGDITISFDTGSNFLFAGKHFANIDIMKISGKKAEIKIRMEGMGDRKNLGKFETAAYSFVMKDNKWLLKNVKYE